MRSEVLLGEKPLKIQTSYAFMAKEKTSILLYIPLIYYIYIYPHSCCCYLLAKERERERRQVVYVSPLVLGKMKNFNFEKGYFCKQLHLNAANFELLP